MVDDPGKKCICLRYAAHPDPQPDHNPKGLTNQRILFQVENKDEDTEEAVDEPGEDIFVSVILPTLTLSLPITIKG